MKVTPDREKAKPVREVATERDAKREVWENADGSRTARLFTQPKYFKPDATAAWTPIANDVVPDGSRQGAFRNRANDWTVRFSPIDQGGEGGVELTVGGRVMSLTPKGARASAPQPGTGANANTVTYGDVWSGVDVRYTVLSDRVKEDIVVRRRTGKATFDFHTRGFTADENPRAAGGFVARETKGDESKTVRLSPVMVLDRAGKTVDRLAKPTQAARRSAAPHGRDELSVAVDQAWLDGLRDEELPIVIDPTVQIGAADYSTYTNWGGSCDSSCPPMVGNRIYGDFDVWHRTVAYYPYESLIDNRQQVLSAWLHYTKLDGVNTWHDIEAYWASFPSFDGAAPPDRYQHYSAFSDTQADIDLTGFYQWLVDGGHRDVNIGLAGDEVIGTDTWKVFDGFLEIVYNNRPPEVPPVAPAQDAVLATTTPLLSITPQPDVDGQTVHHYFRVSTGADGESGGIVNSGWQTGSTWRPPKGSLQNGVTYYWHVWTTDGQYLRKPEWVRSFKVDMRLGAEGPSPRDSAGPVTVNMATGNVYASVATPTISTVGGGLNVGLQYNSLAPPNSGLRGSYWWDANNNAQFDDGTPLLVRTDPQVDFDWAVGAAGPALSPDQFLVRWEGFVTAPVSGTWRFGVSSDDGFAVYVNGAQVSADWTVHGAPPVPNFGSGTVNLTAGQPVPIRVDYYEAAGGASMRLFAKAPDGTEQVVPTSWLSTTASTLPAGWTLSGTGTPDTYERARVNDQSVTLVTSDGTAYEYKRVWGAFAPPPTVDDVMSGTPDGRIQVQADDGDTYTFAPDGHLESIVSNADDRKPAATAMTWTGNPPQLSALRDPVSGTQLNLYYGGAPQCPTSAPLGLAVAPTGLLCLVDDGNGTTTKLWYLGGQLGRVENPGGSITDFAYSGNYLTSMREPLAADARLAGVRTDNASIKYDLTYEQSDPDPALPLRAKTVTAPAPRLGDQRPLRTYTYAPSRTDLVVEGTQTLPGYSEASRRVTFDESYRQTSDRDATGRTTTTAWTPAGDLKQWEDDPAGMRTSTVYDVAYRPVDNYGPAPASWFKPDQPAVPQDAQAANVPRVRTAYDEGILSLAASWWDNRDLSGSPKRHSTGVGDPGGAIAADWGAGAPFGFNPDNWSLMLTGDQAFMPGTTELRLRTRSGVRMWINDNLVIDNWDDPGDTQVDRTYNYAEAAPYTRRRLRIALRDYAGAAQLEYHNSWFGSSSLVNGLSLSPRYGLKTSTIDADDKKTQTVYSNAAGIGPEFGLATQSIVDPAGLALATVTSFEQPGVGYLRATGTTLPAGAATATTKSYWGDTESTTNECNAGQPVNQGGRLRYDTSADPDGAGALLPIRTETAYDKVGRIVGSRRNVGTTTDGWTCTTYDTRGRTTVVSYPTWNSTAARTVTTNYAVGGDPTVTSVTDTAGTITTKVDLLGRTIEYTDVWNKKTTTAYDRAGNVTGKTYTNLAATGYTNDAAGRLLTQTIGGSTVASATYDATSGRLTNISYPTGTGNIGNGTTGTFGIDALARPNAMTWSGPGGTLLTSDGVTRSLGGDVKDQSIDGVDTYTTGDNFTYDGAGRLSAARVPGHTYTYNYAATGGCGTNTAAGKNTNRTSMVDNTTTTTYCYDNADRLTSTTPTTVAGTLDYDNHGNAKMIFGETHTYDIADRHLTTVKGSTTVSYVRDALDRIIERKVNGTATARYSHGDASDSPSITLDSTGAVIEAIYQLPGGAMLTTRAAGNVWSYPNIHGDTVAVANNAGVKQGTTTFYDPYGAVVSGLVPDNAAGSMDYGWLGRHQRPLEQQAGLSPIVEMGARQYSPLLGRFIEVDPVQDGTGTNAYGYVVDPINDKDLDGRCSWRQPWKCAKKVVRVVRRVSTRVASRGTRIPIPRICNWCVFLRDKVFAPLGTLRFWRSCINGVWQFGTGWGISQGLAAVSLGLKVKNAYPPLAMGLMAFGCGWAGYRGW